MHSKELKKNRQENGIQGKRVFGVVCKGYPIDFQLWLDSARTYGIFVIFSKSSRIGKLIIDEVSG